MSTEDRCCICWETWNPTDHQPISLQCHHSVCTTCFPRIYRCPLCRAQFLCPYHPYFLIFMILLSMVIHHVSTSLSPLWCPITDTGSISLYYFVIRIVYRYSLLPRDSFLFPFILICCFYQGVSILIQFIHILWESIGSLIN